MAARSQTVRALKSAERRATTIARAVNDPRLGRGQKVALPGSNPLNPRMVSVAQARRELASLEKSIKTLSNRNASEKAKRQAGRKAASLLKKTAKKALAAASKKTAKKAAKKGRKRTSDS